jgi:hypothetical protein
LFKNIHPSFKIVTHGNKLCSSFVSFYSKVSCLKSKIKTCGEVYADSAYANKKNDEKLGQQNNKVLHRAYRNTPLTDRQKQAETFA